MACIREAFARWMPLLTQLQGEQLELMQAAIDEAFSVMAYTPVEIASRQWDVYQNAQMAEELADVLEYLLSLDDEYRQRASELEVYDWIHLLFVRNYVFWIDCVLGINKPVPVTENQPILRQYHRVLSAAVRMAERMEGDGKSEQTVGERARKTLERFLHLNPSISGGGQS
jgi:hypothetical protein